jgi:hypothetical protein
MSHRVRCVTSTKRTEDYRMTRVRSDEWAIDLYDSWKNQMSLRKIWKNAEAKMISTVPPNISVHIFRDSLEAYLRVLNSIMRKTYGSKSWQLIVAGRECRRYLHKTFTFIISRVSLVGISSLRMELATGSQFLLSKGGYHSSFSSC